MVYYNMYRNSGLLYADFFFLSFIYYFLKLSCLLPVQVVPKKISDYQVPEKIHSKAGHPVKLGP